MLKAFAEGARDPCPLVRSAACKAIGDLHEATAQLLDVVAARLKD